jgi:AcrR family transcriptional regulator
LRPRYDARRNELIDIAARLYAERGYHGTSVDDLVEATGLQRGGLYHYIEGKHDLLVGIHDRFIEPLLTRAREIAAEDGSPEAKLRELACSLMGIIATYQDHVTVFLNDWRAIKEGPGWERIHAVRREFESIVEQVLDDGRANGHFAITRTRLPTMAFLGMINYSYQWYDPRGSLTPDEIGNELASIFLQGINPSLVEPSSEGMPA